MTARVANPRTRNRHNCLPMPDRFWSKVDRKSISACWEWQAYRGAHGYGRFRGWPTSTLAHRVAYELTFGPVPIGLGVLHKCDNPPCCNPAHLYAGSQLDNTNDRKARKGPLRGRRLYGENHWMTKITNEQAREIRDLADTSGLSDRAIGEMYGISRKTVGNMRNRVTWRCLDGG